MDMFKGKNRIRGIIFSSATFIACAACISTVFAKGTVSVSADKQSAAVSDTIQYSVTTSQPEDPSMPPSVTITYDPNVLSFESCDVPYGGGGGGLITITGTSANLTFTALAESNAQVSAEAVIDDDGNDPATASASVTIGQGNANGTAAATSTASSDATLRVLNFDNGNLSPAFSPTVTDYTLNVDAFVTDIKVSGAVSDSTSSITAASGFKGLKEGENKAVITVTAQDGTSLTYNFKIVKAEAGAAADSEENADEAASEETALSEETADGTAGSISFEYAGVSYTIADTFSAPMAVEAEAGEMVIGGQTVEIRKVFNNALTIVTALNSQANAAQAGATAPFIMSQDKETFYPFEVLKNGDNVIALLKAEGTLPAGFIMKDLAFEDGYTLEAYQLSDMGIDNAEDFYLVYAMNQEGVKEYYLYDVYQKTFQRYLNVSGISVKDTTTSNKKPTALVAALIIALVLAIMIIVNLIIRNKDLAEEISEEDEKEAQEEKPVRRKKRKEQEEYIESPEEVQPRKVQKQKKLPNQDSPVKSQPQTTEADIERAKAAKAVSTKEDISESVNPVVKKPAVKKPAVKKETVEKVTTEGQLPKTLEVENKAKSTAAEEVLSMEELQMLIDEIDQSQSNNGRVKSPTNSGTAKTKETSKNIQERPRFATQPLVSRSTSKLANAPIVSRNTGAIQIPKNAGMEDVGKEEPMHLTNPVVKGTTGSLKGLVYDKKESIDMQGAASLAPKTAPKGNVKSVETMVPIVNLKSEPLSALEESASKELDDDFELEFIHIGKD